MEGFSALVPDAAGIALDQPLHNYYIAASHNTSASQCSQAHVRYLMKDQLKGPSDPMGFENALKLGCKFVEGAQVPADADVQWMFGTATPATRWCTTGTRRRARYPSMGA